MRNAVQVIVMTYGSRRREACATLLSSSRIQHYPSDKMYASSAVELLNCHMQFTAVILFFHSRRFPVAPMAYHWGIELLIFGHGTNTTDIYLFEQTTTTLLWPLFSLFIGFH